MKNLILLNLFILMISSAQAQVTIANNNPLPANFVGYNGASAIPLPIRNDGDRRINLSSNGTQKYAITELPFWAGLNGLLRTNVHRTTLGLQGEAGLGFSMLDLRSGTPNMTLARMWMNIGTTMLANNDIMYTGLLERPVSGSTTRTDAVIAWGGAANATAPDNFRFIYLNPTGGQGFPASVQGLETMRITPRGFVGVGNFAGGGIGAWNTQPNAKLHVFMGDELLAGQAADNIAVRVYNNTIDPPGTSEKYGIFAEADANYNPGAGGSVFGGRFIGRRGIKTFGVWGEGIGGSGDQTGESYGLYGIAYNVDFDLRHYGVSGLARGATENIGVYGEGVQTIPGGFTAGVFGRAVIGENQWAGYFDGLTFCTDNMFTASDESLKQDITEIADPNALIMALQPKKYRFNQEINALSLDDRYRYGFLAQEIEEVIPELVRGFNTPLRTDSAGTVIAESMSLKAIQYEGIIPILVAAYQGQISLLEEQSGIVEEQATQLAEQAATIEALQDQMATVLQSVQAMQAKTANCCQENGSGGFSTPLEHQPEGEMKLAQNVPNPFVDVTRIDFELPNEAQIKLEITDVNGRSIDQLINGQMSAGLHTIQWDGSSLAPGVYFYSLYSNGQLLTKKMIKR